MVRIVGFKSYENSEGEEFFGLVLQGGVELVKSEDTGRYYATAKQSTISSTFTEEVCKSVIGQDLPGRIVKTPCEPFEYTIQKTGEVVTLEHRWEYREDEPSMESQVFGTTKSKEII